MSLYVKRKGYGPYMSGIHDDIIVIQPVGAKNLLPGFWSVMGGRHRPIRKGRDV